MAEKVGRNAPCPCGSGAKYKNCCLNKARTMPVYQKILIGLLALLMAVGVFAMFVSFRSFEPGAGTGPGPGKVWSEEHQHWH
jgi:hypothetical protein